MPKISAWSSAWLPFLAGAASASLLWTAIYLKYELYLLGTEIDYDSDDDEDDSEENEAELQSNARRKRLMRWPWDKLRDTVIHASTALLHISSDATSDLETERSAKDKTGHPCIGAIFGLDVGGTLTKLVYFEEQIHEYKRTEPSYHTGGLMHHRKTEQYHAAASAFQVLQARTDTMKQHDDDSNTDLHRLMHQRIESVPDRLDEFASSYNIINSGNGEALSPTSHDTWVSPGSVDLEEYEFRTFKREASASSGNDYNSPTSTAAAATTTTTTATTTIQQHPDSPTPPIKKSMSLVDIPKSNQHAEALNNFYSFARRLDTYQTAVKEKELSYYSRKLRGQFHFIRFETRHMQNAMNLMRINNFHQNIKEIGATGGGAHKYANEWDKNLGIQMAKQDEMDSLVAGMQFVMSDIVGECYTFKPNDWKEESSSSSSVPTEEPENTMSAAATAAAVNGSLRKTPSQNSIASSDCCDVTTAAGTEQYSDPLPILTEEPKPRIDQWWTSKKVQRDNVMGAHAYPYLLVSIGTGVSILRVDGPRQHERVSGSTIGGGTYWGLCRLLTGSDSFSDVLNLAMKGDPSKVDMMVGDIYGKNSDALEKIGLPSDIVASSFGKLVAKQNPSEDVKEEDLARALLLMVTNNIGQVAHLNARLHNTARIYFVGTFLQHNTISQQRLAHAIDYWSKGEMEAQFLEHEGYFGALGAFLLNHGIEGDVVTGADPHHVRPRSSRGKKRPWIKMHHRSNSMNFTEL